MQDNAKALIGEVGVDNEFKSPTVRDPVDHCKHRSPGWFDKGTTLDVSVPGREVRGETKIGEAQPPATAYPQSMSH